MSSTNSLIVTHFFNIPFVYSKREKKIIRINALTSFRTMLKLDQTKFLNNRIFFFARKRNKIN